MMKFLEWITLFYYKPILKEYTDTFTGVRFYLVVSLIPWWATAQAVGKNVYVSSRYYDSLEDLTDEVIADMYVHVAQWERYGALNFLWKYFSEMAVLIFRYGDTYKAFKNHSMELESEASAYRDDWGV